MSARRHCAIRASAVAGVLFAGIAAAGCAHQSVIPPRASVESCIQFGIGAIKHHGTVSSVPAACRGLTRAQVNFAAGSALRAMAATAHGKVQQRKLAATFSHFLAHLIATVPEQQRNLPVVPALAGRPPSRAALGLVALVTWLITIGLGFWMTARRTAHGGLRRASRRHARLPLWMISAHSGLAVTGLLGWIVFLVTGWTSAAWGACVLLLPVTGLGLALVIRSLPEHSGPAAAHTPTLTVAVHGMFAVATILFALLAAVGSG